jgi:diphthamide synthase (EF-2-diphthine--ammonia ligase)
LQKLILLNPPYHKPLIRDYNCSHLCKGAYQWAPIDLVVLNANLQDYFDVQYFDLIKKNSLMPNVFSEIEKTEILISLVSYISIKEDLAFLRELKQKNNKLKMYILGDIALFNGEKLLAENEFLHGKINNFTAIDIENLISGSANINPTENNQPLFNVRPQNVQLFQEYNYAMPYSRYNNVATVLALNYGCKFHCKYCNSNQLGYMKRDVAETIAELKSLKQQGVKEVYFRDFTLNAEPEILEDLCEQIIKKDIKIIWSCDVRIDLLSELLLIKMKKAGCFLVFFGIETNNKIVAQKTGKLIDEYQLNQILNLCKKEKILTLGSFLFGLPGDNKESIEQIIKYALNLKLTYASFNVLEQRTGVNFAINEPRWPLKDLIKYQSLANRKFYFRINKILDLLSNIQTMSQFKNAISNGVKLIAMR